MNDDALYNLIWVLIVGTVTGYQFDIWQCSPGVRLFGSLFINHYGNPEYMFHGGVNDLYR